MELFLNNKKLTRYLQEHACDIMELKSVKDRPLTEAIERYVYAGREDMIAYAMMSRNILPDAFSTLNKYLYKAEFVSTGTPETSRFLYGVATTVNGEEIHIPMVRVTRYPNTDSEALQRYYGDETVVGLDIDTSEYDREVIFYLSRGHSLDYLQQLRNKGRI